MGAVFFTCSQYQQGTTSPPSSQIGVRLSSASVRRLPSSSAQMRARIGGLGSDPRKYARLLGTAAPMIEIQ